MLTGLAGTRLNDGVMAPQTLKIIHFSSFLNYTL